MCTLQEIVQTLFLMDGNFMKNITLILIILGCTFLNSQNISTQQKVMEKQSVNTLNIDSLKLANERIQDELQINRNLLEIMEKTNQQLNLWTNPFSYFIGALGVLFAIAAIIAGVLLYRQSKEYKEKYNKLIQSYDTALKNRIEEWKQQNKDIDTKVDKVLASLSTALPDKVEEIKKELEKLINGRLNVIIPPSPIGYSGYQYGSGSTPHGFSIGKVMLCKNCRQNYFLESNNIMGSTLDGGTLLECPKCHIISKYD